MLKRSVLYYMTLIILTNTTCMTMTQPLWHNYDALSHDYFVTIKFYVMATYYNQ